MCLPDRLERNCSSCLILDQLMAGAPSPMLHRQCGILCRKILNGSETVVGFGKLLKTFLFFLSPPLFLTGFIGNILDPHYIFRQRRHLGGAGGAVAPQGKRKKKKRKKKRKKRKKREKKRKKRKKGTMNSVKLLHIKCCFFQFFNSLVALKN